MALIKCPECGKEVSDKAKMCPHCGFEVADALSPAKTQIRIGFLDGRKQTCVVADIRNGNKLISKASSGDIIELDISCDTEIAFYELWQYMRLEQGRTSKPMFTTTVKPKRKYQTVWAEVMLSSKIIACSEVDTYTSENCGSSNANSSYVFFSR